MNATENRPTKPKDVVRIDSERLLFVDPGGAAIVTGPLPAFAGPGDGLPPREDL